MDDYIELMHGDMLADGEMTAVVVEGHNLLVARVDGEFYVTDERCPHLHAHLSKGSLAGTVFAGPENPPPAEGAL